MHDTMKRLHQVSGLIRKKDIAAALGVADSTVTNWGTRGLSTAAAMTAADLYGVDVKYLLEGKPAITGNNALDSIRQNNFDLSDALDHRDQIPVLRRVSKYAQLMNDHDGEFIEAPLFVSDRAFALVVDDRSMMPEFNIRDYVIVDQDIDKSRLKDGDYVVAQYNDDDDGYGVIMVVQDFGMNGMVLTQTNGGLATLKPKSVDDYTIFGIVDRKITKYR